ncbi:MAG: monoamine oxidase [Pseudomonadales bacterium]|nr:monoamine oxidase [Pseudomonadales bacterium]RLU01226.1 MAG: NAD(P)/FAD-dependent oxidoreductase [Ketobacter sp.]
MAHSAHFKHFKKLLIQARNSNLNAQGRSPQAINPGRRAFLRNSAIGGAALASSTALTGCLGARSERVAIIGGGLAGLNTAYQLGQAGMKVKVYEARRRLGGRVHTIHNALGDGLYTDLGAELVNSDHDDMLALIDDFGIGLTNRKAPSDLDEVAYYFGGYKRSEAEMAAALAPLAAQLMLDAELLDEDWDTYAPIFDNLSLKAYLDQHQDKIPATPDIRDLVEGAVRVEYGVEPNDSSALQLLYLLPVVDGDHLEVLSTSDEMYAINGGSETVVDGLRAVLEGQLHTDRALTKIKQTTTGFRLGFNKGRDVEADYVVLALPFTALRHVDMQLELPETLHRFIHEVDLGRNEKVIAGMSQRVWLGDSGFQVEAWSDQTVSLLWDASQRQPELPEGALTFFAGANEVDVTATGTAAEQGQALIEEFSNVIPGLSHGSNGKFLRTAWHNMPYIGGGYTNFKPGQYTELAEEWLYIEADDPAEAQYFAVDNLVFAGEHTSDEYYGFMNGAAQSGRLAAQYILQCILKES